MAYHENKELQPSLCSDVVGRRVSKPEARVFSYPELTDVALSTIHKVRPEDLLQPLVSHRPKVDSLQLKNGSDER
ncbi:hypothetical protein BC939DRAFT_499718 [Gamsiella multidivaricata]|uniref:uncharacterized protein n=1 Tax=Gamsiella multidivaricata TaxID=101098 RepID=UPI002220B483|nr:uncharacterized protein BC939DRAFT_499718 [Gamsiella multidivaricata]KAI7830231.1 hypothetical protein BC939DRAFT_499718 [Gamsiella multidivaricata]